MSDLAQQAETLNKSVTDLTASVDDLAGRLRRNRLWTWVLAVVVVAVAGLGVYQWRSNLADKEAACRSAAETRTILREMVRDGGITSGVTTGEALIHTFPDADPAVVELFRANLGELDPALVQIVNELPDRQWIDGACVDVPVGE